MIIVQGLGVRTTNQPNHNLLKAKKQKLGYKKGKKKGQQELCTNKETPPTTLRLHNP